MDDLLREFLTEAGEHLDTVDSELVRFEQTPDDDAILRNIFRLVHSIKGTCGFLGLPRLEALAHAAETLMGRLRDGMPATADTVSLILATVDRIKLILAELDRVQAEPDGQDADIIGALDHAAGSTSSGRPGEAPLSDLERAWQEAPGPDEPSSATELRPARIASPAGPGATRSQTIRVAVGTLEHLMTMVSELVLTRNQLLDVARRSDGDLGFKVPLQRLSQVTAELQDGIMKTRMQPIGSVWAKLPRLVRDLAPELGKRLDLAMTGAETELDRQLLDHIRDPITHLVRNAADHGIEPPEERRRLGKPAHGTIRLRAFQEGGSITIEVGDDGRGIDHAAIRRQAAELGTVLPEDLARMSEDEVAQLIFHPGFSTARALSTISGRGVGMDVVKTNIAAIGGTVEIESEPGHGATFVVKIPLTLAIVAALIVSIRGQRFALPQIAIVELVRVRPGSDHSLERMGGAALLRLRNELLPVIDMAALLRLGGQEPEADRGYVVVAEVGRRRFGLLVESVIETEEIVVKPMSSRLKHLAVFSGNTILGDGGVVLIVDLNGVARTIGADHLRAAADHAGPTARTAARGAETTTLLLFRGADRTVKAVPLSLVTRLEELDAATIEETGGRPCIQYRGRLMPLVPLAGVLKREGTQPVIVLPFGNGHAGLAVEEILDVVDAALEIEPIPGRPDLVGSAIVRDRATEILDLAAILPGFGQPSGDLAGIATGASGTLLLVDDNPFFRDMLAPVLKAAGYRVRTAASAADALAMAAQDRVAVVVADIGLPDRSGLDLVAELRRRPGSRDVVAILLGSAPTAAALERARALDIYDVVSKFDRSGLMAALAEMSCALDLAA